MLNESSDQKLALGEGMGQVLAETVDLADPAQRIGATLFVVLKNQLELLGYRPGTVPFDARFGSDGCRGALLGTAIAVVRGHRAAPEREHYIDTIIAAFNLVYGEHVGRTKALETIEDSAARHAAVNAASDLAGQDTAETWSDDSPSAPMAFHRAATGAL